MSGQSIITALTFLFGLLTLGGVVVVLYRLRRWPIVALIRAAERRAGFHRDTMTMLASALHSAQLEGRRAEFERLAASYRLHRDSLHTFDAKAALPADPPLHFVDIGGRSPVADAA